MYCPSHFHEDRPDVLAELIKQFPLATVVRNGADGMTADHLPVMFKPSDQGFGKLVGHVAKGNSLWQVSSQDELLVVFQGPSTYISPNWYASKRESGNVVPTWNYVVVHACCTLSAIQEHADILAIITELTDQHEAAQERPWKITDAPAEFTAKLLSNIVGISLEINRWHGKWKVSQNQPAANQESVIQGLVGAASDVQTQMAALIKSHGAKWP